MLCESALKHNNHIPNLENTRHTTCNNLLILLLQLPTSSIMVKPFIYCPPYFEPTFYLFFYVGQVTKFNAKFCEFGY